MADIKVCLGCGEEEARFKLIVNGGKDTVELFCADCMGHVIMDAPDDIKSITPLEGN